MQVNFVFYPILKRNSNLASTQIIVTGGPDYILRLWNPLISSSPKAILAGHSSGIQHIFLQDKCSKIYSIDKLKIINVWDANEQSLIQTFTGLKSVMTEKIPIHAFYNDLARTLVVAAKKIVHIKCCPLLRLDLTDGYTHTKPISVVLYNDLFKTIVTCGFDSFIIVWNPWTGKRQTLIEMAHSRVSLGETIRVEITAACFDVKGQLLLTGAQDGTLKVFY